jgi:hypothetical protein
MRISASLTPESKTKLSGPLLLVMQNQQVEVQSNKTSPSHPKKLSLSSKKERLFSWKI